MTREQALRALDRLDRYWSWPRWVRQSKGYMPPLGACGCFGAHVTRALHPLGWLASARFTSGVQRYFQIAEALDVGQVAARDILRRYSECHPFGMQKWHVHPNAAWPKISAALREGIREGESDD